MSKGTEKQTHETHKFLRVLTIPAYFQVSKQSKLEIFTMQVL